MINPDTGDIIDANEAAGNFYGWSRDQLRQMKIQDINTLPPAEIKKKWRRPEPEKSIFRVPSPQGRWFHPGCRSIQF